MAGLHRNTSKNSLHNNYRDQTSQISRFQKYSLRVFYVGSGQSSSGDAACVKILYPAMIIIYMFPFIFPKFLATWIILSCQGWLNTEEKHSGETEYNSAQDYNHKSTSWSKSQIATYQKESTWGTLSNKNTQKCGNFLPIYLPVVVWSFCGSLAIPTFSRFSFWKPSL